MDADTPKKNWLRRHKFFSTLLVALVVVGGALFWEEGGGRQLTKTKPAVTPQTSAQINASGAKSSPAVSDNSGTVAGSNTSEGAPVTPVAGGNTKMTVSGSNVTVNQADGSAQVTGSITNNQKTTASANIQAIFYDKSGGVLGKATGNVSNVAPGATKPYTLNTAQDVSAYDRTVVEVSSIK